jgi:serine/threonine protein kinase
MDPIFLLIVFATGTAAWMSPEMIGQHEGITTATDVWSFGVVLWEMFSRQVPYLGLTEFKIYSIVSEHGARLVIPESCPTALAKLLENCWNSNAKQRPDIRTGHIRKEFLLIFLYW